MSEEQCLPLPKHFCMGEVLSVRTRAARRLLLNSRGLKERRGDGINKAVGEETRLLPASAGR